MKIKQHLSLLVGLSLPVLLIIFVIVTIYLPTLFVKPQFDFIYSNSSYGTYYEVINNTLQKRTRSTYSYDSNPSAETIYLYDVTNNKSRQISYAEASRLVLDSNPESPDGFSVVAGNDSYFFPFSYSSSYGQRYLKGKGLSKKLSLSNQNYYFKFIGWVK